MPKCPHCNAPGERHPYAATVKRANGALGSEFGTALCHTCGGTNEITETALADIQRGERLRDHRVHELQVSLRERARLLCIPASVLSWIEHGRVSDENRELAEELYAEVAS